MSGTAPSTIPCLYTVRLLAPDFLSENEITCLLETFETDALSYSVMQKNNAGELVELQWIFDYPPNKTDLVAKITLTASIHNLKGIITNQEHLFIEEISKNINWLEKSYQDFDPFEVGAFFIYGANYKDAIPNGKHPLQIDAATAFGSGSHGTTKGCLEAIEELNTHCIRPSNILDMGTGSGILSIACRHFWDTPILAVDNDPDSITLTKKHCDLNKTNHIKILLSDGFTDSKIEKEGPFDLILANILAAPLKTMAPDLSSHTMTDGYAILSGMLKHQADALLECYSDQGFSFIDSIAHDEWVTLIFKK